MKKTVTIQLPSVIEDGRLDTILKIFSIVKSSEGRMLRLDWTSVTKILPAGQAILACLYDQIVEQGVFIENLHVKKRLKQMPVIHSLLDLKKKRSLVLPKPSLHDCYDSKNILSGAESAIHLSFMEHVCAGYGLDLSEDMLFSLRLISNELMQNSVDHSTSERYYLYAGRVQNEFHLGILDMGITIPAKLEQKYTCNDDIGYLELSFKEGISTRRQRQGGLGLSHTFDLLKSCQGRLTLLSRNGQVRRYFGSKTVQRSLLKYTLHGTWCFVRFPLEGDAL